MRRIHLALVLVAVLAALTALAACEDPWGAPAQDEATLAPIPEEQSEPTLAPPEPASADPSAQVMVVQVDGEVVASGESLAPIVPVAEPQGEPTPALPEAAGREGRSRGAGPRAIVVHVEAEQVAGSNAPAGEEHPQRPETRGS